MNLITRVKAAGEFFRALGETKSGDHPSEAKSAYDKLPVGVQGRAQRPASNLHALNRYHKTNELVFACIRAIAYAASDPEPEVERRGADGKWHPDEAHPLRRLLLWPNPTMDGALFMQRMLASAQITGYFYAEIVRDGLDLPDQLWPLDPTKLAPVAGNNPDGSNITGYEFRDGAIKEFIPARNMLAYRLPNPASQFQALSPLEVCVSAVDAESAQTDYIRAFFNSGGAPAGVLKLKAKLDEEKIQAVQQKWLAKYSRRGTMRGAPAVLDQDADYQKIGSSLNELEADALRGQSQAAICSAFGVPPIIVGAYVALMFVNQRASVRESQHDFWQNTMSPMFKMLRLFFTTRLLAEFESMALVKGDRVRMTWNMEHVAGMQEDADAVHKRAREDFAGGGLTWNEYRVRIGETPDPDGEFIVLPKITSPTTPKKALALATATAPAGTATTVPAPGTKDTTTGGVKSAVNPNGAPEVKGYQFDGLTLRREPTELEKKSALPQISRAMDTGAGRLRKTLLAIRETMIADAVRDLQQIDEGSEHTLALDITGTQSKKVWSLLTDSFEDGRASVKQSLANQKTNPDATDANVKSAISSDAKTRLYTLADAALTKLANDVQARAVGRLSELVLLGYDRAADDAASTKAKGASFWKKLEEDLLDSSTQYAERAAAGATNAALNFGREAEAEDSADSIKEVVYSAVLDQNTCAPCEDADGETGASDADIPSVPNAGCDGGSQCRCIHIYVVD